MKSWPEPDRRREPRHRLGAPGRPCRVLFALAPLVAAGPPADQDASRWLGAVDSPGQPPGFPGRGPAAEGRTEPEVVRRGQRLRATSFAGTGRDQFTNGAHAAATLPGGAAAIVMQSLRDLPGGADAAAALGALMEPGRNAHAPGGALGDGLPRRRLAILFPEGVHPPPLARVGEAGVLQTLGPRGEWTVGRANPLAGHLVYGLELADDPGFTRVRHRGRRRGRQRPRARARVRLQRPVPGARRGASPRRLRVRERSERPLQRSRVGAPRHPRGPRSHVHRDGASAVPVVGGPGPTAQRLAPSDVQILSARGAEVVLEVPNLCTGTVTLAVPRACHHPYLWRGIARPPLVVADTAESGASFVVTSRVLPPGTLLRTGLPEPGPASGAGAEPHAPLVRAPRAVAGRTDHPRLARPPRPLSHSRPDSAPSSWPRGCTAGKAGGSPRACGRRGTARTTTADRCLAVPASSGCPPLSR